MEYEAYHVHSHISNVLTQPDSTMKIADYAKVYRERDMHVLCLSEHGNRSNVWEQYEIAEKYKADGYHMIPLAAAEAYFVPCRNPELKDDRNFHMVLVARNQEGFYQLNECLSEANISGFYGKARIDFELLEKLNPKNFICTTACVGGIFKDPNYEKYLCQLKEIMRDSLYIEVQHHPQDIQIAINQKAVSMYKKHGIPLIYGTDSHYINHEDAILRKELLLSSGISNGYEDEFDLYLPTATEAFELLKKQGVLSVPQIEEAMENTLILRTFKGVHFDRNRKMPNCKPELSLEQRNSLFKHMVCDGYIEKEGMPSKEEAREIHMEMDAITDTDTADYFIVHKEILDKGKEYGGILTQTSRGSAASFVVNYALGFTTINRLHCPVMLYPDRFISKDRLAAGSNPDIDLNLANVEAFERAGKEILGEYGCLPMIAYGTNKTFAAFKMLARARDLAATIANEVSKQILNYQMDLKHAIENNVDDPDYNASDDVRIESYVEEQYIPLIEESKQYQGIIVSFSPHPCGHILLDRDMRREFGVISMKKAKGSERFAAAYIDGTTADAYGYLKADFLRVDVVKMIADAFKIAGHEVMPSKQLLEVIDGNKDIWNLYKNGFTMGLNQCEREKSTQKCMRYQPSNIVELAMFIAGIRPGFASQIDNLLTRTHFSYNIPALDSILQNQTRPDSFIIFDEDIMHIAQFAGISGSESYALIKAVKKKKPEKVKHYHEQLVSGFESKMLEQGMKPAEAHDTAEKIWKIVEGSASYLFNLAHAYAMALDSAYGAYLKATYPYAFYSAMLKLYSEKKKKEKIIAILSEMKRYKQIRMLPGKLGQDNTQWLIDEENKTISQALNTVKFISSEAARDLAAMKDIHFETFSDCMDYMQRNTCIDARQREVLIGIGYFDCYGTANKLLFMANEFRNGKLRITKTLSQKTCDIRLPQLRELEQSYVDDKPDYRFRLTSENENIGLCYATCQSVADNLYFVQAVDDKYSVVVSLYNVKRGTIGQMKIKKSVYTKNKIAKNDFIYITDWKKKQKAIYANGKRKLTDEYEFWIESYQVDKGENNE